MITITRKVMQSKQKMFKNNQAYARKCSNKISIQTISSNDSTGAGAGGVPGVMWTSTFSLAITSSICFNNKLPDFITPKYEIQEMKIKYVGYRLLN
jgi:hypothetical protein